MGMNLDELEQAKKEPPKRARSFKWDEKEQRMVPLEVTNQIFGAKDYIKVEPFPAARDLIDPRLQPIGSTPVRRIAEECNAVSGLWEMCERGTVGCTNHRRRSTVDAKKFFPCYLHHHNRICMCSQPVIVDQEMLKNVDSASLHVLSALRKDLTSRLTGEDRDYLAISLSVIMAHWARKALGHKPEDERG